MSENTSTLTLHAHVSTASRDCDGGHGNDYVSEMNDDERKSSFPDLDFKARILSNHTSFHSEFGVTLKVDADGFTMSEPTDEGHRSAEIRWCEDSDCDPNSASQYDQYAEMMGY
jgi:hypothetical protein